MYSIFEVPWEQVGLEQLRSFLADADEEGVIWEAKADDPRRNASRPKKLHADGVRNSVCGLANQVGGYVILGARRDEGRWELPGVEPPSDEPGLWLDQVMRGLRPVPRYFHHHWIEDDRLIAVVRVEPLTATPCMTRDGQVFERTSSETVRVTGPVRLQELFQRGKEARERAEKDAALAANELFEDPDVHAGRSVWVGLGLAAGSYEPDISSRLFHSRFRDTLDREFGRRLFVDAGLAPPVEAVGGVRQGHVEYRGGDDLFFSIVRAHWSGRVGVIAALAGDLVRHQALLETFVIPSWKLAADLVERMGGYGDARMQLSVCVQTRFDAEQRAIGRGQPGPAPPAGTLYATLPALTHIQRATELGAPQSDEIGSIQRELNRAAGLWVFEGAPDLPESLSDSDSSERTR